MWGPIIFNVLAFGATALVCHGELAKDRPGTKHLTEFYLLMSVGGVLGGIFNGIIAPVVFIYVWEFSIAVICACFLRPKMREGSWVDDLVGGFTDQPAAAVPAAKGAKGHQHHHPRSIARAGASEGTTWALDFVLPIIVIVLMVAMNLIVGMPTGAETEANVGMKYFLIFGIPLALAAVLFFGRPLRFGLAIAGIMIFHSILANRNDYQPVRRPQLFRHSARQDRPR